MDELMNDCASGHSDTFSSCDDDDDDDGHPVPPTVFLCNPTTWLASRRSVCLIFYEKQFVLSRGVFVSLCTVCLSMCFVCDI